MTGFGKHKEGVEYGDPNERVKYTEIPREI